MVFRAKNVRNKPPSCLGQTMYLLCKRILKLLVTALVFAWACMEQLKHRANECDNYSQYNLCKPLEMFCLIAVVCEGVHLHCNVEPMPPLQLGQLVNLLVSVKILCVAWLLIFFHLILVYGVFSLGIACSLWLVCVYYQYSPRSLLVFSW